MLGAVCPRTQTTQCGAARRRQSGSPGGLGSGACRRGCAHGGGEGEAELLASCYRRSLELAETHALARIAFPCISTGVYGYPARAAAEIAVATVRGFSGACVTEIIFCCFSEADRALYAELCAAA